MAWRRACRRAIVPEDMDGEAAMTNLDPTRLDALMRLAEVLSKSGQARAARLDPADVLLMILTGEEFGWGPGQSLRSFHAMQGKLVLTADAIIGLCLAHHACEFFTVSESTDRLATYTTKRKGAPEPVSMTWDLNMARRAGLNSGTWKKHPEAMLRARCAAALARAVYPDAVGGIYSEDEGREIAGEYRSRGRGERDTVSRKLAELTDSRRDTAAESRPADAPALEPAGAGGPSSPSTPAPAGAPSYNLAVLGAWGANRVACALDCDLTPRAIAEAASAHNPPLAQRDLADVAAEPDESADARWLKVGTHADALRHFDGVDLAVVARIAGCDSTDLAELAECAKARGASVEQVLDTCWEALVEARQ